MAGTRIASVPGVDWAGFARKGARIVAAEPPALALYDVSSAGLVRAQLTATVCERWLSPDRRWLFTGDLILGTGTTVVAPPDGDMVAYLASLRRLLDGVYGPGPGIYELATPTTVVCRCEDVTLGQVVEGLQRGLGDVNAIKSATRAGMGLCQGRACARQVLALVARHLAKPMSELPGFTPRPPVRPVPLGLIADERPELPRAPVID